MFQTFVCFFLSLHLPQDLSMSPWPTGLVDLNLRLIMIGRGVGEGKKTQVFYPKVLQILNEAESGSWWPLDPKPKVPVFHCATPLLAGRDEEKSSPWGCEHQRAWDLCLSCCTTTVKNKWFGGNASFNSVVIKKCQPSRQCRGSDHWRNCG